MTIPRLVSPDDHIQEPAHVWETRLPARLRDRGPRIERLQGPVGLELLDRLGTSQVLYETDYPHTDTMWPTCQEAAAEMMAHLDPALAAHIAANNAAKLFRIEL